LRMSLHCGGSNSAIEFLRHRIIVRWGYCSSGPAHSSGRIVASSTSSGQHRARSVAHSRDCGTGFRVSCGIYQLERTTRAESRCRNRGTDRIAAAARLCACLRRLRLSSLGSRGSLLSSQSARRCRRTTSRRRLVARLGMVLTENVVGDMEQKRG
jgi:hypothetical protein